jgi:hypothetical protein
MGGRMEVFNKYEALTQEACKEGAKFDALFLQLVKAHPECSIHDLEQLVVRSIGVTAAECQLRKAVKMRREESK